MTNHNEFDLIHHTSGIGHHVQRRSAPVYGRVGVSATELVAGEKLVLDGLRTYTIGSVVSYAMKNGDDPVAAIDRARKNGHELVFIYGNGAMIYSGARMEPTPHVMVEVGMVVRFQGNLYTIEKAPNQNLRLQALATANVEA